ncbi:MAG: tetratricopeptide repeat protein, partial [Thermodesulfobacteriota bacterium]|nr:tetratricopeptide repeat protein [Thermodesulfobacteriota bacterium]
LLNKLIIYFVIIGSTLLCYMAIHSAFLSRWSLPSFPYIFYSVITGLLFLYPFLFINKITEKLPLSNTKLIWLSPILLILALFIIKKKELNPIIADIYFKRAKTLIDKSRYDESVIYFKKALDLVPNQDLYYTFLGKSAFRNAKAMDSVHLKNKYFRNCEGAFRRAREINPLSPNHTRNLGVLMQEWGKSVKGKKIKLEKFKNSLNYFEEASKITPYSFRLYRDWGMTYFFMERYREAIIKYRHSIVLKKNEAKTFLCLGDAYRLNGDYKNAKSAFKKALHIEPKNLSAYHTLSYLYFKNNEMDKAIKINRDALKIDPGDIKSIRNLIFLYEKTYNYEKAAEIAKNALKYAPEKEKASLKKVLENLKEKLKRKGVLK